MWSSRGSHQDIIGPDIPRLSKPRSRKTGREKQGKRRSREAYAVAASVRFTAGVGMRNYHVKRDEKAGIFHRLVRRC